MEEKEEIRGAVKEYLNPNERFAKRVKQSMDNNGEGDDNDIEGQEHLFAAGAQVSTGEAKNINTTIDGKNKKSKGCNVTPFLLMIALSVHSFFEGLACGL